MEQKYVLSLFKYKPILKVYYEGYAPLFVDFLVSSDINLLKEIVLLKYPNITELWSEEGSLTIKFD